MNAQRQALEDRLNRIQKNSQDLISRMDRTISGITKVRKDLSEKGEQMTEWVTDFKNVIQLMAVQIVPPTNFPHSKPTTTTQPNILPVEEVYQRIKRYEDVLILTGAGVSKESGISTFRGQDGLYERSFELEGKKYSPEQFITKKVYREAPRAIWKWTEELHSLIVSKAPGKNHQLIHQLALQLAKEGKVVTLVTTNIDGFHKAFPHQNKYAIHEIHGNIHFKLCESCGQSSKYQVSSCQACGSDELRPNMMFFDEQYRGPFGGALLEKFFPLVISVGSSLCTGMPSRLVSKAEEVVEINPKCVLEDGRVCRLQQDCGQVLQRWLECEKGGRRCSLERK